MTANLEMPPVSYLKRLAAQRPRIQYFCSSHCLTLDGSCYCYLSELAQGDVSGNTVL